MSPKRKLQATADFDEYALKDVPGELRKCDQNLAAAVVLDFVYESGFTLRRLGKHEAERPAFASATWEDVATNFQLDASIDYHQLELFSYPVASLPPSFHREVMKASAKWLDVYQERGAHKRGAARMRLMDAWHVPVCSLFKGRLVDQPESFMPETPETSRGQVDHKVYMTEGIILLVMELKLAFKSVQDHIAQVLLELCSAFEINSDEEFKPQPPVYAILTDLEDFHIFRYDGSQFTRIKKIIVSDESRVEYLSGMQKVSDHLFSVILEGYIGILAAVEAQSFQQGEAGVSKHNSAQVGKETLDGSSRGRPRPSLGKWSQALVQARKAQSSLVGCKGESMQSWEAAGSLGLSFLNDSISLLPKIGSINQWDAVTLDNEIEKILSAASKEP